MTENRSSVSQRRLTFCWVLADPSQLFRVHLDLDQRTWRRPTFSNNFETRRGWWETSRRSQAFPRFCGCKMLRLTIIVALPRPSTTESYISHTFWRHFLWSWLLVGISALYAITFIFIIKEFKKVNIKQSASRVDRIRELWSTIWPPTIKQSPYLESLLVSYYPNFWILFFTSPLGWAQLGWWCRWPQVVTHYLKRFKGGCAQQRSSTVHIWGTKSFQLSWTVATPGLPCAAQNGPRNQYLHTA